MRALLTAGARGCWCPLPLRKAVLGPVATAAACPLEADLLKALLVVRPHELVEACGVHRAATVLSWGLRDHGPPTPIFSREQEQPWTLVSTPQWPQHCPRGWVTAAGQGTLEQAVLLGVLREEWAEAGQQSLHVVGALVVLQGPGEGVEAGLAQRLLHGHHEQLGPACLCTGGQPLLLDTGPGAPSAGPLCFPEGPPLLQRVTAGRAALGPGPGWAGREGGREGMAAAPV